MKMHRNIIIILAGLLMTACTDSQLTRLAEVGTPPAFEEIKTPMDAGLYRPATYSPEPDMATNSLWQPGAKTFFRDQRARFIGDILRVRIEISDKAAFDNKTNRKRSADETLGVPKLFGYESLFKKAIPGPGTPDPAALLEVSGAADNSGEGKIDRKENIQTEVAAIVTNILPNGNLVIKGSQEIRVNFEVRELSVAGVIRPEDIDSNNVIDSNQIADARISYGGRGQITDVQQPRMGHQVVDILSPF